MSNFSPADADFMQRALTLAEASVGLASPNPQVGCVLVRDGVILGEGAHIHDRFDHAEVAALKQARAAGHHLRGATAYVTLEPCSHHGRTPPCADALIAADIVRCVVATVDPNPQVEGTGIRRMSAAGIAVEIGLLEAPARRLNNAFALSITRGRPFVTLKAALSADSYLAPPPSQRTAAAPYFLTGPEARAQVQQLRHASDAILTGIGTVLADDPLLKDRTGLARRRPLLRVVLDSALHIASEAKLLNPVEDDLWIFCGPQSSLDRTDALLARGVHVITVSRTSTGLDLNEVLHHLHQARILSVLLEAGSALNGAFLRQHLVDRAILFYAEAPLGPGSIPFAQDFPGPLALEQTLQHLERRSIGSDLCVSGLLHDPWLPLPPDIS